jgi:transglutaminase-like putative cysteine protease
VDLPTGPTKLLKVDATIDFGGQTIETTMWTDDRGQTLKSHIASIGQEAVRTTKELALNPAAGAGDFDLLVASTVKLQGELPNPTETKRVVYRARLKSGDIAGLFAAGLSQRVEPIDERTAELTVLAVRPDQPAKLDAPPSQPTEEDLAANTLIQSDDPEIVKTARSVAPSETDPWKLACALEQHVDSAIRKKNFSQAFATAAEVARSLEGDCTEHAVLLAALCRARGIPARVAFGLVYYPPQRGFAYHMWNEVWIADRWVPLDGTLGLGGIGGDHIKLADSNLAGASAYSAMLPVIQVFGRLDLEVVEAE